MPSKGILLMWNRGEAMTWHTASVSPAGALSCLSRLSRPLYVCVAVQFYNHKKTKKGDPADVSTRAW